MTDNEKLLASLLEEQNMLEDEIRTRRDRIRVIATTIKGAEGETGLGALVAMERAKREWIEGEPARAAMRATPEWQAWWKEFQQQEKDRVDAHRRDRKSP